MTMKRIIALLIIIASISQLNAQTKKYLEIRGSVDLMGNISLSVPMLTKEQRTDTLIKIEAIKQCFKKSNEAIDVINRLTNIGWNLFTITNINRDKEGRPNTEFIAYYFVKEF